MSGVLEELERVGRGTLARFLDRHGPLSMSEYSQQLNTASAGGSMEAALHQGFESELARVGVPREDATLVMKDLVQRRVLQTTTHVTLSEGPSFFASHYMASLGLDRRTAYLVGACSGIPFSNVARPGCLNYSMASFEALVDVDTERGRRIRAADLQRGAVTTERRLSLVPASQGSDLVFGSTIPAATAAKCLALRPQVQSLTGVPRAGESFTRWAALTNSAILTRALGRQVICIDLNEVISRYLQSVLQEETHPLHRLLFHAEYRLRVLGGSFEPVLFSWRPSSGSTRMRALRGRAEALVDGDGEVSIPLRPRHVLDELLAGRLCPGIFLTFGALVFLNGFRCVGGVDQLEYLPIFQQMWRRAPGLPQTGDMDTLRLAIGRMLDPSGRELCPLDVSLGLPLPDYENVSVEEFLRPQLVRALRRPFDWFEGEG